LVHPLASPGGDGGDSAGTGRAIRVLDTPIRRRGRCGCPARAVGNGGFRRISAPC